MTPREWDAGSYDRVGTPMTVRGVEALDRLELGGGETVLDAGCGTGRVTEALLARLPEGRVVALDASQAMLDVARERLGDDPRVTYLRHDLAQALPFEAELDGIVTTSTLHWVHGHDRVFAHFGAALRPGGRLVVECGGAGNIARIEGHLAELAPQVRSPWNFAGVQDTRARLEAAGFSGIEARLRPRPETIAEGDLAEYLRTVVLGTHLQQLGPKAGEALVADVAARLDDNVVDYVRLEVAARRA